MTEIRKPVRPIMVNKLCDSCKDGTMHKDGGIVLMVEPPTYSYKCNICGFIEVLSETYPRIEYADEGEI